MEKKTSGKSIIWKTLTINKGFGEINNELPDIKTMQETNREHRKQQERKEINSEVSAIVQIEHAWKYIMNSGQRARNPKRSSSSIKSSGK